MTNIKDLSLDMNNISKLIEDFIKNSVNSSHLKGVVIAVSGGVDSATALAVSVRALGKENVMALSLPECDITPNQDISDVIRLCSDFEVTCEQIEITPMIRAIIDNLSIVETPSKIVLGNLKARLRMLLTYYHANTLNYLVIGTSNKTERLLGYFTKYGDGAADILPLADLYKCQVRQLASFLHIPESIVNKPASPRLWLGHETEKELGLPYDDLDMIVYHYLKGLSPSQIALEIGIDLNSIKVIVERIKSNEHKRNPPLALRLS